MPRRSAGAGRERKRDDSKNRISNKRIRWTQQQLKQGFMGKSYREGRQEMSR